MKEIKIFIEITLTLSNTGFQKTEKLFESDDWEERTDHFLLWKPVFGGKASDRIYKKDIMQINMLSNYASYNFLKHTIICEGHQYYDALDNLTKYQKEYYNKISSKIKKEFDEIDKIIIEEFNNTHSCQY